MVYGFWLCLNVLCCLSIQRNSLEIHLKLYKILVYFGKVAFNLLKIYILILGGDGERTKDKNHWLTQACRIIFNFDQLKDLEVEFMDDSQGFTSSIR